MRLRNQNRRRRGGVVLLIVVACIVVAGLAMVSVTRKSLRLATDSIQSETELQQRWGAISVQRTMLHAAPKIFADSDKRALDAGKPGPFPSTVRSEVLLGGIKFDALLADEQAKVNLNAAYHTRSRSTAERLAGKMAGAAGLRVRLLPEVASNAKRPQSIVRGKAGDEADEGNEESEELENPPRTPAFRHWGQVFDLSNSQGGSRASQRLPSVTSRLTLWGRGEVNITRAPDDVIEETCRTALGPGVARKLVRQYRENPSMNVKQIAMQLEVDGREVNALGQLLTTQSSTYSLWLNSESLNGEQRWFAVAAPNEEIGIKTERFRFQ